MSCGDRPRRLSGIVVGVAAGWGGERGYAWDDEGMGLRRPASFDGYACWGKQHDIRSIVTIIIAQ